MFPKFPLMVAPTPLHRMDRASAELGVDLWMKRDDLTGFALGGNKARKLEFLVADWLARGVQAVVTCGAAQSNFIRQLAAACRIAGIECHAVVMRTPYEATAGKPETPAPLKSANWLLSERFGAKLTVLPDGDWDHLFDVMEQTGAEVASQGLRTEVVPVGGSVPLGAWGFYQAGAEVDEAGFDTIFFASSSGSTHVGLATRFFGTGTRVVGVACDPEPEITHDFADLSAGLADLAGRHGLRLPALSHDQFELDLDYVGAGYGVPSAAGREAEEWLLRQEGIVLDPTYTAKAFACLLARARSGERLGKCLFWHTGGTVAQFTTYEGS